MSYASTVWNWLIASGPGSFAAYFSDHLRDNLFNGCLTLGGFLLAAYTFIIIHMKTSVYDSEEYGRVFEQKLVADGKLRRYQPLQNLSRRLFCAVSVTLIAGALQLTLGLIEFNAASLVCVLIAIYAAYHVGNSLRLMGANLKEWFESIDEPQ